MSIKLTNVSYTYMAGTPYEKAALNNINLEIIEGQFVGIIGHTGSGKSTLVQHLNGLLKPMSGEVQVDGVNLHGKSAPARIARRKVGMVFQYPEHQLFEETVCADIAFGPKNLGLTADEIELRVRKAMEFVGLDFDTFSGRSPFQLSGGQMRRVAIAGVIALEPQYLVLDEPSAGLDPRGRDDIFGQILELYHATGITIIMVSHNMEEVARMANRLIVMKDGNIFLDNTPEKIFSTHQYELSQAGVAVPNITALLNKLKQNGLNVNTDTLLTDKAVESIMRAVKER